MRLFLILSIALLCIFKAFSTVKNSVETIVLQQLEDGLKYVDTYSEQINLDGALGIVLAEANLVQIETNNLQTKSKIKHLIKMCKKTKEEIKPNLPKAPEKMMLFQGILLDPKFWTIENCSKKLPNFGIYNWSVEDIFKSRVSEFKGVSSDVCLEEILGDENCHISELCEEMMFANRIDTGYLLTHRLFYLEIGIRNKCFRRTKFIQEMIERISGLMLKEAKTNAFLGFRQHDLFLEQLVLCGLEGFDDFKDPKWLREILSWQTAHGCFKASSEEYARNEKRSMNVIEFGCTDHTTGLGIAALASILKYVL